MAARGHDDDVPQAAVPTDAAVMVAELCVASAAFAASTAPVGKHTFYEGSCAGFHEVNVDRTKCNAPGQSVCAECSVILELRKLHCDFYQYAERDEIVAEGGLKVLIELVRTGTKRIKVVATAMLSMVAAGDSRQQAAIDAGYLLPIVGLLRDEDDMVKRAGGQALHNIAVLNPGQTALLAADAIKPLAAAMRLRDDVSFPAADTLCWLARGSASARQEMLEEGVLDEARARTSNLTLRMLIDLLDPPED